MRGLIRALIERRLKSLSAGLFELFLGVQLGLLVSVGLSSSTHELITH